MDGSVFGIRFLDVYSFLGTLFMNALKMLIVPLIISSIITGVAGLPVEAVGLILAVDRVLDTCRTSVNVFSDSCGAVLIGRFEGETGILADKPA